MVWRKPEDMKNIEETGARVVFWIEEYPGIHYLKRGWTIKDIKIETDYERKSYDIAFEDAFDEYYIPNCVLYWAYEIELWDKVSGGQK